MNNRFFGQPILNSPYEYPVRHWEFDDDVKNLKGDDKKEAGKNNEAARLWITSKEFIQRQGAGRSAYYVLVRNRAILCPSDTL